MIPRIFERQPVIIVAGGPSLRGFEFSRLAGKNTIAINRAYEFLPDATVLWWTDSRFWRKHRDGLLAHRAQWKATVQVGYVEQDQMPAHVARYRITGHKGFEPDPRAIRTGNNSTYACIHLAPHLGADFVVVLGLDMRHGPNGESHFHDGHGLLNREETMAKVMIPWFSTLIRPLAERGVTVLNASPDSALDCWPRCPIEEGLRAYEEAAAGRGKSAA